MIVSFHSGFNEDLIVFVFFFTVSESGINFSLTYGSDNPFGSIGIKFRPCFTGNSNTRIRGGNTRHASFSLLSFQAFQPSSRVDYPYTRIHGEERYDGKKKKKISSAIINVPALNRRRFNLTGNNDLIIYKDLGLVASRP